MGGKEAAGEVQVAMRRNGRAVRKRRGREGFLVGEGVVK